MKKQIITAISLHLLFASAALAKDASVYGPSRSDHMVRPVFKVDSLLAGQPEIKFIGYNDDFYFFELQISNPLGNKIEILLMDKSTKNTLYSDFMTELNFNKRVAVPRENISLQWVITNKSLTGKSAPKPYSLSTEVKLKDEVKVTRL
jgi:hypothetical protein